MLNPSGLGLVDVVNYLINLLSAPQGVHCLSNFFSAL